MHDLKTNFDKIYEIAKDALGNILLDGNARVYRHKPKMTDLEIIVLSICQESLAIDSEHFFGPSSKTITTLPFPI